MKYLFALILVFTVLLPAAPAGAGCCVFRDGGLIDCRVMPAAAQSGCAVGGGEYEERECNRIEGCAPASGCCVTRAGDGAIKSCEPPQGPGICYREGQEFGGVERAEFVSSDCTALRECPRKVTACVCQTAAVSLLRISCSTSNVDTCGAGQSEYTTCKKCDVTEASCKPDTTPAESPELANCFAGEPPPSPPISAQDVQIEYRSPRLGIPIPGLPVEFSKIQLEGPQGGRYLLIPWIAQYIVGIVNFLLGIVLLIATVMVIAGGFTWLMAGGAPDKITDAKKRITNAVVGLILALATYLLLNLINPKLTSFEALKIGYVERIDLGAAYERAGRAITLEPGDFGSMPPPYDAITIETDQAACPGAHIGNEDRAEALRVQHEKGIPAAILLAQWALESDYGRSCLGNNCFGIKCTGAAADGTRLVNLFVPFQNQSAPRTPDPDARAEVAKLCPADRCSPAATWENISGSKIRGYACFASDRNRSKFEYLAEFYHRNSRYHWEEHNANPRGFARRVQASGYATDPNYAASLIRIMQDECLMPAP